MNAPCCFSLLPARYASRIRRSSPRHRCVPLRSGFTILELLLASLFGAILLAGIWNLLRTYERLFTTGEARSEQAQLVRAVFDQLAEDLTRAIADNAAAPSTGPVPVRRFGLFGTSQSLRVDVLRPLGLEQMPSEEEEQGPGRTRPSGPRVPELFTVQWRFSAPSTAFTSAPGGRLGRPSWSGLARRELDWETPVSAAPPGTKSRGIGRLRMKFRLSRAEGSSRPKTEETADWDLDDPSVMHLPEVVEASFRYFDGQGFTEQWNSLDRKSLPMAVEVVLRFQAEKAVQRHSRVAGEPSDRRANVQPETVEGEVHRMVIYLPTTSLARRPEAERPSLTSAPAVVFRPRGLPPPPRFGATQPLGETTPPDQWMRTGQ